MGDSKSPSGKSGSRSGCVPGWVTFAIGFLSVWPALLAGVWLQSWFDLDPRSVEAVMVFAALPEELIKFAAALGMSLWFGASAAVVGLGFGMSETIFLVSASPWPIRLLTSIPLHAGTTALACVLVKARRKAVCESGGAPVRSMLRLQVVVPGTVFLFGSAVVLHWVYNIAARQNGVWDWFLAWLPLVLWALLRGLVEHHSDEA